MEAEREFPELRQVVVDCTDARLLAEFYRQRTLTFSMSGPSPSAPGARLLCDHSHDPEEPLRVYADPAGHPFCIFVAASQGMQ